MKTKEGPEYLKALYGRTKLMTIQDLVNRMAVSEITVRRKLKQSGALTSYNKNGRYYTLPHIPTFNSHGLWNYRDIRFSKYGNLNQTITGLIGESSSGLAAEAIGELIGYSPHSLLHQLCIKSVINREKLNGKYVYFSIERPLYEHQRDQYESFRASSIEDDLPCITAVRLLIEKIRRPKESAIGLTRILVSENSKISELQVKRFLDKHGLEKKTPDSR